MRGSQNITPDDEMLSFWREYLFRKNFGGSHSDFMDQPQKVTEILNSIEARLQEKS